MGGAGSGIEPLAADWGLVGCFNSCRLADNLEYDLRRFLILES
jgi:hypothetical protein